MPTYLYRCLKCGEESEREHPISFDGEIRCHSCGNKTERLISASTFILKGRGWYKDGYSKNIPTPSKGGNRP